MGLSARLKRKAPEASPSEATILAEGVLNLIARRSER